MSESEAATEKCRNRFDLTAQELERTLLQREGESVRDTAVQARSPGGVGGKRVIGKAVAKGGMLLKGKNPGNVRHTINVFPIHEIYILLSSSSSDRRKRLRLACRPHLTRTGRPLPIRRLFDKSTSISSYRGYYGYE